MHIYVTRIYLIFAVLFFGLAVAGGKNKKKKNHNKGNNNDPIVRDDDYSFFYELEPVRKTYYFKL